MSNITPDLMKLVGAACKIIGDDLAIDTGQFLYTSRGLAWCAEYLRNLLGATQDRGPTTLAAMPGNGVAIISAAMPRLNEAWADIPDQVLGVRKLCVLDDHVLSGPPLNERDGVLLVDSLLADGGDFVESANRIRETGARVVGGFVIVDLQHDGSHQRLQEADIPMLYSVTTRQQIVNFLNRQTMMGG